MQNSSPMELHTQILRNKIPEKFGFEFNRGSWNSGFVVQPGHTFLFVTLEKSDLEDQHQYKDGFVSLERFHWQSQNRTKQDSKHGRLIRNHESMGESIHLFARPARKVKNKTCPFTYCGKLNFVEWHGEQPINVVWDLQTPISTEVVEQLQLNFEDVPGQLRSQEYAPAPEPAQVAEPKIADIEPTQIAKQVVSGDRYLAQKVRHSRFRISDDLVLKLLSLADRSGGTVSLRALSLQSGVSNHRLIGAISTLQKLFNFDSLQIIRIDREVGNVVVNRELIQLEFINTNQNS